MSLCGLLKLIVLSYLLETASTVVACYGRPCLFVFDLLGAKCLAAKPQANMQVFPKSRQALIGLLGVTDLKMAWTEDAVYLHV